jgi:hypothetical protein
MQNIAHVKSKTLWLESALKQTAVVWQNLVTPASSWRFEIFDGSGSGTAGTVAGTVGKLEGLSSVSGSALGPEPSPARGNDKKYNYWLVTDTYMLI